MKPLMSGIMDGAYLRKNENSFDIYLNSYLKLKNNIDIKGKQTKARVGGDIGSLEAVWHHFEWK